MSELTKEYKSALAKNDTESAEILGTTINIEYMLLSERIEEINSPPLHITLTLPNKKKLVFFDHLK